MFDDTSDGASKEAKAESKTKSNEGIDLSVA
jgi:hypothetical protein